MPMSASLAARLERGAACDRRALRHALPHLRRGRDRGRRSSGCSARSRACRSASTTPSRRCRTRRSCGCCASAVCGFDCASVAELELARMCGARGERRLLHLEQHPARGVRPRACARRDRQRRRHRRCSTSSPRLPSLLSFRFNPGAELVGERMIGNAARGEVRRAARPARGGLRGRAGARGAALRPARDGRLERAGGGAAARDAARAARTGRRAVHAQLGIACEFVNAGGGLGIPYRPGEPELDLEGFAPGAARPARAITRKRTGRRRPALFLESGRYVTGPHGVLVTRVLNRMSKWREYVGVDAGMSALMRPAMYGGLPPPHAGRRRGRPAAGGVDVVGALCENNDKFAMQRELPALREGDLADDPRHRRARASRWASTTTGGCGLRSCCCAPTAASS